MSSIYKSIFYKIVVPVGESILEKFETNPKTSMLAGEVAIVGGTIASTLMYKSLWEELVNSRAWHGYNPEAPGLILECKIESALICVAVTLAACCLAILIANVAKENLEKVYTELTAEKLAQRSK